MIKKVLYSVLIITNLMLGISCSYNTRILNISSQHDIIPLPKEIEPLKKSLLITEGSKIYYQEQELASLVEIFQNELKVLCLKSYEAASSGRAKSSILFSIDSSLAADEYKISIDRIVNVRAGSYQAAAMAKATLLQIMTSTDEGIVLPRLHISDQPGAKYRGLLVDVARKWHSIETVKKVVDLCSYYKINYLQLHFTDDNSCTLPSKAFPELPTEGRHYTFAQLTEMEQYSQQRGVTIIPEIEMPGHSSSINNSYPEIFSVKGHSSGQYIMNIGKEEVYESLDLIIGEMTTIFKSSPYFHIGADETKLSLLEEDPDVQTYMRDNKLGTDINELYRHFIVRMNDIVKKHGRQMCIWEGFAKEGYVKIPKDIIIFEFETSYQLPGDLLNDGYTVVNTSWKPLYVVNGRKWSPEQIYGWNMWRWEHFFASRPSFKPIQCNKTDRVIGAQMCSWEQDESIEFPSIRRRLPALSERVWSPEAKLPVDDFMRRLERTDSILSILQNDKRQDEVESIY